MATSVQVLNVATDGCSPTLLVITPNHRFLFDVCEGTQRLLMEHKSKVAKMINLFFTETSSRTLGGLPGLFLTIADVGIDKMTLTGPMGMIDYWNVMKPFTYRPNINVTVNQPCEIERIKPFITDELIIHTVTIGNEMKKNCYFCQTPSVPGKFDVQKAISLNVPKGPMFGILKKGLDITLPDGVIVKSESVVGPSTQSKYILIIGDLSDGHNAFGSTFVDIAISRSENEQITDLILKNDWKQFQERGENYLKVDCIFHFSSSRILKSTPYNEWVKSFGPCSSIAVGCGACTGSVSFLAATTYTNKLNCISPRAISRLDLEDNYSSMNVNNFITDGTTTSFKMTINNCSRFSLESISYVSGVPLMKANILTTKKGESKIEFPTILHKEKLQSDIASFKASLDDNLQSKGLLHELALTQTIVDKYIASIESPLNPDHRLRPEESSILSTLFDIESDGTNQLVSNRKSALWFLGTACAIPSKYRNVSGTVLRLHHSSALCLMDCGEGSWYQLVRLVLSNPSLLDISNVDDSDYMKTKNKSKSLILFELARQLRVVFVSHPHADHHLGLLRLIEERKKLLDNADRLTTSLLPIPPLLIIAPKSVVIFIHSFVNRVDGFCKDSFITICNDSILQSPYVCSINKKVAIRSRFINREEINIDDEGENGNFSTSEIKAKSLEILKSIGIETLETFPVVHCSQAYGMLLRTTSIPTRKGFSIVFSGDTRPCDTVRSAAADCTILLHEATFADEDLVEAVKKKHSTISEAVEIRKKAKAFRLVLTHFSQRYPVLPTLSSQDATCVIQSFDFMALSFGDLLWAPLLSPITASALSKEIMIDEDEDSNIMEKRKSKSDYVLQIKDVKYSHEEMIDISEYTICFEASQKRQRNK